MSTVATHEISNPLTAIQNLLFLIQDSPSVAPGIAGMARQAEDEVLRIGAITRSTLGFFRQDEQPDRVDLRSSAESVRFLLEPVLRMRGIQLVVESAGDCAVNAFSMETRHVLLNLVRNACEATLRSGAQVKIAIEGRLNDVRVVVEDEGSGIAPAMLANLFQFGVSTKGDRGNGIGLWAVKQLVTRHGGTVEVESTQGKGSCFTVCWPRQIPVEKVRHDDVEAMAGALNGSMARLGF
jgi:signal transduction histidine kinase